MTQSLEAVNAYDKAQSEVKRRRKKTQKFVDNLTWNEIVRAMFLGEHVINLAIKYGVSDKTIYKWRRHVIEGTIVDRYHMTNETIEVLRRCQIMFRDNGVMKQWNPNQSYLERLRELNRAEQQLALNPPIEEPPNDAEETMKMAKDAGISLSVDGEFLKVDSPSEIHSDFIERLKLHKPEIIKILKEQPVGIENLLNRLQNRSEKAQDQPLVETSTLLQAPNGDRLITEVNDAQLMMFLKGQGFTIFKITLDEI